MTNVSTVNLIDNDIYLEIDGTTVGTIDIPSDYVAHTFAPILGQHLFLTGDKLKEGMIVVLGDKLLREDPGKLSPEYPSRKHGFIPSEHDRARIETSARWALVTDLRIVDGGRVVKFTAVYADGTMRERNYSIDYKWAVRKHFTMVAACPNCGSVHTEKETPSADSDPYTGRGFLGGLLGAIAKDFLGEVLQEFEEDEDALPDHEARRPDESDDEYFERRRDEEEKRGEYAANEALRILREKLTGQSQK